MMKGFHPKEELARLIERKRLEMIETAHKTGISSYQTLRKSIELDQLLNLHHQVTSQDNDKLECVPL